MTDQPRLDHAQLRCPPAPRFAGDLAGCGSTNLVGPDDEGIYDCLDCGLWFTADAAEHQEEDEDD